MRKPVAELQLREGPHVPIAKYFATVGSALFALLLIADRILPEPPAIFVHQPQLIDEARIRIKSARKWPEKIVFNTNKQMTMVTPEEASPD
jgi:hypothetical protein